MKEVTIKQDGKVVFSFRTDQTIKEVQKIIKDFVLSTDRTFLVYEESEDVLMISKNVIENSIIEISDDIDYPSVFSS